MAFHVTFTEAAADDLDSIAGYIGFENASAARRICSELFNLALSLAQNPLIGRASPEYNDESIRDIVHSKYRIVYLVDVQRERIQILRFWHGARGFLPEGLRESQ